MTDVLTGWFAYIVSANSGATFWFACIVVLVGMMLVRMQMRKDNFDFRAIISTWKDDHYVPTTDKTLLVGCWLVSSYAVMEHYSDTALGAYLTIWVLNGGIAAWSKVKKAQAEK